MKFTSPLVLLLGSILYLIYEANATPLTAAQRGIVKMPLKRLPTPKDIHPQLVGI